MLDAQTAAWLRQVIGGLKAQVEKLERDMAGASSPMSEINRIEGRRIAYTLVGTQTFTTTQDNTRAGPINMLVSQDGPFVMTHYPFVAWRPSLPTTGTNFGQWSPIYSFPVPTQDTANQDFINISYELVDGGSQRNFQNLAAPPIVSTPDNMHLLPVPTLFAPNATVQFIPTYQDIFFDTAPATDTTEGTMVVALPGFRIVNM